jgi:hypothetical protein
MTLLLTHRDVDQNKRAKFLYPLDQGFACILKLRAAGAEEAAAAASGSKEGAFLFVSPQSEKEAWEDD